MNKLVVLYAFLFTGHCFAPKGYHNVPWSPRTPCNQTTHRNMLQLNLDDNDLIAYASFRELIQAQHVQNRSYFLALCYRRTGGRYFYTFYDACLLMQHLINREEACCDDSQAFFCDPYNLTIEGRMPLFKLKPSTKRFIECSYEDFFAQSAITQEEFEYSSENDASEELDEEGILEAPYGLPTVLDKYFAELWEILTCLEHE